MSFFNSEKAVTKAEKRWLPSGFGYRLSVTKNRKTRFGYRLVTALVTAALSVLSGVIYYFYLIGNQVTKIPYISSNMHAKHRSARVIRTYTRTRDPLVTERRRSRW